MSVWLLDLADAARASGLPVVETDGWRTRGHGPMEGVRTILCHHTAGPAEGDMPSLGVVTNGRPDLPGPLCNLALARSGTVYVVAAGTAWHAGEVAVPTTQSNVWAVGIEAEATGVDPWPPRQYDAYVALCRALIDQYGLSPARVLGHKEVAVPPGRKIDPNFDMDQFRAAVAGKEHTVELSDRLPDLYTQNPADSLTVGDTMAWGTAHAAFARESAAQARDLAEANAAALAQLQAELDAVKTAVSTVQTGNVDYQQLAVAVADELNKRLAS